METQTTSMNLDKFLKDRQQEILALAQKTTEKIVKTELALSDFELLLAANLTEEEIGKLTEESRNLRGETWQELSKKFNGDTDKIQERVNEF